VATKTKAATVTRPHPTEPEEEPLGRLINLTAKAMRSHFDLQMAEAGSTFSTWTVLATLEMRGPMIQRQLAAHLSVEGPTLTRSLAMMENLGLVERSRSGADRRATTVQTTDAGRALFIRLRAIMAQSTRTLLDGVTPEEMAVLRSALNRIRQNSRRADARRHRAR
jgi:MarR family transcriptional regulator for hemolysin